MPRGSQFGINLPEYNPIDLSKGTAVAGDLFNKAFTGLKDIVNEREEFTAQQQEDEIASNTQDAIAKFQNIGDIDNYDAKAQGLIDSLPANVDKKAINEARNKQETYLGTEEIRNQQIALNTTNQTLRDKELAAYDGNQLLIKRQKEAAIAASNASTAKNRQALNEANADIQAVTTLRNTIFNTLIPKEELDAATAQLTSDLSASGLTPGTAAFNQQLKAGLAGEKQRIALEKYRALESDAAAAEAFEDAVQVGFVSKGIKSKLGYADLLKKTGFVSDATAKGSGAGGGLKVNQQLNQLRAESKLLASQHKQQITQAEKKVETSRKALKSISGGVNHDVQFRVTLGSESGDLTFDGNTKGGNTPMSDINDDLSSELKESPEAIRLYQNLAIKQHGYDYFKQENIIDSDGLNIEKYKSAIKAAKASLGNTTPEAYIKQKQTLLSNSVNDLDELLSSDPEEASLQDLEAKLTDLRGQLADKPKATKKEKKEENRLERAIKNRKAQAARGNLGNRRTTVNTAGIRG